MPPENPRKRSTVLPQTRDVLSGAYSELATAVESVVDAVCERHKEEVRAQFAVAAQFDDDSAIDDLPSVLKGVAKVLEAPDGLGSMELLGPAHASARDGQGFSLSDVFGEYVLLRRSLAEHVARHLGRPLSAPEAEALQSGMDALLATTLMSYVAQREDRLRLETNALANFLSSLSHDLRNEINGVMTTLHSLEELGSQLEHMLREAKIENPGEATRSVTALLREVKASREVMESTIDAMTLLLEAERGRHQGPLQERDVALFNLMQSSVRSAVRADKTSPEREVSRAFERVKLQCPEGLLISTDPDLLGSVLVNLMGNAVKHAPDGDIHFTATVSAEGGCRLEVRDEGPGIPAADLEKLFDKFERAARGETTGLGLGLFIARRAADLLGAKITVNSSVGVGSSFIIELPPHPPRK